MRPATALRTNAPDGLSGGDRRVAQMASLIDYKLLADDFDAERLLVVPHPGGPLARVEACEVAGCSHLRHGASPLCSFHRYQFSAAGNVDLDTWLVSGAPGSQKRRWFAEERCVVHSGDERCERVAVGTEDLCRAHDTAWRGRRAAGASFVEFLAGARPLPGYGPCVAASCHLEANRHQPQLCEAHHRMWRAEGRPGAQAFLSWAARVRQPANGGVLSLRGLPELVRLEVLYAICCRVRDQIRTATNVHPYLDHLRAAGVSSVLDFDLRYLGVDGDQNHVRFARYCVDRVHLAYAVNESSLGEDVWDLRLFGHSGRKHLDFGPIRQRWLREATKAWAADALVRVRAHETVKHRVQSIGVLSAILAAGPGAGDDPSALSRSDIDRFLVRVGTALSPATGHPYSESRAAGIVVDCALVIREAREMGLFPNLGATFSFRRHDGGHRPIEEHPGRALPAHVIAQLDAHLDLLATLPGSPGGSRSRSLGVLGERAGEMAVLVYELLKGTGRRVGEIASLHLRCLEEDEHERAVLVYDNHKTARMGRRLPLADSALVQAIRAQQTWVIERFPGTAPEALWLLPRASKNADGTAHLSGAQIHAWMRSWVRAIPRLDAGTLDAHGDPIPFDRAAIHPHAFRHTYAQTLADQGVPFPVLRDLMDHRSPSATLGYYRIGEEKKREAMELLARHTVDRRATLRPLGATSSASGVLHEQLSWVAVPMGRCAEPTNVRAGGQACPIRYQCAACPHFESDPSYLPELHTYADDLRKERETMLATGAAAWAVDNVEHQIAVIGGHISHHEATLASLPAEERALLEDASATVRKARQSVPVAFGRRREGDRG